jgi:hypothetical protein
MLPAVFERGDLERSLDRPKIRHDHLPVAHRPAKKYWRSVSSEAASLKMPLPEIRAVLSPAPSNS